MYIHFSAFSQLYSHSIIFVMIDGCKAVVIWLCSFIDTFYEMETTAMGSLLILDQFSLTWKKLNNISHFSLIELRHKDIFEITHLGFLPCLLTYQ